MKFDFEIKIGILLTLLLFGCQKQTAKKKNSPDQWNYITIGFGNTILKISNFDNTLKKSSIVSYQESHHTSATTYMPDVVKEKTIKIKSGEKDSIYKWTKTLVEKPLRPKVFCTDYAGKLFLDIQINDQLTQSCRYNSICEWSTLTTETVKLNKLFEQILN